MPRLFLFLFILASGSSAVAVDGARLVWQPILEYMVREPAKLTAPGAAETHQINPFIAYTHIGTDFGFHGPGERFITWQNRSICLPLKTHEPDWAGMWHSLSGLASEPAEVLNFERCYTDMLDASVQPQVTQVVVTASGKGTLKLEIKNSAQQVLWSRLLPVDSEIASPLAMPLPPHELQAAKLLVWTAEPGSNVCLTNLQMGVQMPAIDFDRYVLLTSYAKMARCYSPELGLLKDRAHIRDGAFSNVTATGIFALATAVMSQPDVAMVKPEMARTVLRKILTTVASIPAAKGLLPHFVKHVDGKPVIHPGTEFSTVDTALYYHAMFMAAEMLDDHESVKTLLESMKRVDFSSLMLHDGAVSHGLKADGITVIPFGWRDWGGETALVILFKHIAGGAKAPEVMRSTGKPWQGTGFIAEIQSLFYPDFDSSTPDAVSKVDWHAARKSLLTLQKDYFLNYSPDSFAAKNGLYGLSAGEGAFGTTYEVGGVDLDSQSLVHPHYILMSGMTEDKPQTVYDLLHRMEHAGYLTPWGLVENVRADGTGYLPMISSLNAGFETLAAYHLLAKAHGMEDSIYKVCRETTEFRDAIKLFYPGAVAKK